MNCKVDIGKRAFYQELFCMEKSRKGWTYFSLSRLSLRVGSSYPIRAVVSCSLFITKLGKMRSLCSMTWIGCHIFFMFLLWCTNKPRHPLFSLSVPNQRGRLCSRTWQSLVWTSQLPCIRGYHLGRRVCHWLSMLPWGVTSAFCSWLSLFITPMFTHIYICKVSLIKPPVRAKFCSPVVAQSKEARQ